MDVDIIQCPFINFLEFILEFQEEDDGEDILT